MPRAPASESGKSFCGDMLDKPRGLADTGAILALIDRKDRWHQRCASVFPTLRLPLATSVAVITELFHLLQPRHDRATVWRFLQSDAMTVLPSEAEICPRSKN